MPDKPLWLRRLPEALRQLEESAEPWIDRPVLESLLGVKRRRAQQLLAPIAQRRVGASVVVRRDELITYLKKIAAGEMAYYEDRRRKQLWAHLAEARREWMQQPPVLVEVSQSQVRRVELHGFAGLPEGVELAPGSITVRFREPDEALQKLVALALAISQNRPDFDEQVSLPPA
ncbi:MAG: hypothetical protein JO182_19345 [Acidobacteriaceae bacterium]|nr:hypothetical protein [Acidobacteriaceae bacterium]